MAHRHDPVGLFQLGTTVHAEQQLAQSHLPTPHMIVAAHLSICLKLAGLHPCWSPYHNLLNPSWKCTEHQTAS